jgi:Rrf2 family nitric oxide-sensitive transcriptional repressor
MQLTRFSDLALRLLLYLASRRQAESTIVTARATSEIFNVPYTHMVKVVHRLGVLGLIVTTKGKGGGLRLSKSPKDIRLGEVIRQTEPPAPIINCIEPPCPLRSDCYLKGVLDRAREQFFLELDRYTLEEVARTPSLQTLVQLSVPTR